MRDALIMLKEKNRKENVIHMGILPYLNTLQSGGTCNSYNKYNTLGVVNYFNIEHVAMLNHIRKGIYMTYKCFTFLFT